MDRASRYDAYIICTSPRSGSTLLCKLLTETGVAGKPESYFHCPSIASWQKELNLPPQPSMPERDALAEIFQAAIAEGSQGTGMFGLRLQRHSFDFFIQKMAILHEGFADDAQRFTAAFGRTLFIHLTRQDKVEQAVSYVKAQQTGLWHMAPDGTELERLSPPQDPTYDGGKLKASFDELIAHDDAWQSWFETENIKPLRISYETLSIDPHQTLGDILEHLGLDRQSTRGLKPGVAKLADATSQEWAKRFRAEHNM